MFNHCYNQPANYVTPGTALITSVHTTPNPQESILPKVGIHEVGSYRIKHKEFSIISESSTFSSTLTVLGVT